MLHVAIVGANLVIEPFSANFRPVVLCGKEGDCLPCFEISLRLELETCVTQRGPLVTSRPPSHNKVDLVHIDDSGWLWGLMNDR